MNDYNSSNVRLGENDGAVNKQISIAESVSLSVPPEQGSEGPSVDLHSVTPTNLQNNLENEGLLNDDLTSNAVKSLDISKEKNLNENNAHIGSNAVNISSCEGIERMNSQGANATDMEKNISCVMDNPTLGEDKILLSNISDLEIVDVKSRSDLEDENEISSSDPGSFSFVISETKTLIENTPNLDYLEKDHTTVDMSPTDCNEENDLISGHSEEENITNVGPTTEFPLNDGNRENVLTTSANLQQKKLSATESALQRLASLGVIAEEMLVVESKESALQKLASRGAISITPAGGGPLSSASSSVSVTQMKPKNKPGHKSASLKPKAKKIKIDPGNSLDIDKDFSSLITILSTATDKKDESQIQPSSITDNHKNEESISENMSDIIPEEVDLNIKDSCIDKSTNEDGGMDIDVNDDRSVHETDSESHDGSKSFSHSSDHAEETDERVPSNTNKIKNVIEEGSAEILLSSTKSVFYNKVQEFNRDMSIAALTVFSELHQQDPRTRNRGKKRKATDHIEGGTDESEMLDEVVFEPGKKLENGITILEALSATGLRSIRYAREIPGVKEVIANDLSEDAVDTINKNIEHNGVGNVVTASMNDAALLMYQRQAAQEWYDAIDLDPYGCPSRFLDSAVQAVRDGGLLLVTCTDMAVLAGNSPETCYVKYGAVSLRSPACHEMALRIALQCIESHANRYGRYIVPLLSFSADFYIRLILQVYTSPVTCKKTTSKLSMVYQCVGCQTHTLHSLGQTSQPGPNTQVKFSLAHGPPVNTTCFHCHHKHNVGGPIWSAPMYSPKFLESMLNVIEKGRFATSKRMQGMLEVIREELPDVPLYYTIAGLCTKLHCQAIPLIDIRSAILNAGYRVSSSHAAPTAIKTNAPSKTIWDIMRCWVHMKPVSQKRLIAGSVPAAIILEPPNLIANFDIHPKARPSSSMRKLLRYQQNPEKNWGPGMRARCNNADDMKEERRRLNQNKNKNKSVIKKNIDIIQVITIDDEDEILEEPIPAETAATSSSTT